MKITKTVRQNENQHTEQCFILGQKVIAKKLGWGGNGSVYAPFHRIDVSGIISSVKGMPNHVGNYKYEFSWKGGIMMTNGIPYNTDEIIGKLVALK